LSDTCSTAEVKVGFKTNLESEALSGRFAGIETMVKMTDRQIAEITHSFGAQGRTLHTKKLEVFEIIEVKTILI
jgi:hypothetical protein